MQEWRMQSIANWCIIESSVLCQMCRYWLMCAGDELYATSTSLVGSIGVISANFGFVEVMKRLGLERRVYTAGKNKDLLDPFRSGVIFIAALPSTAGRPGWLV